MNAVAEMRDGVASHEDEDRDFGDRLFVALVWSSNAAFVAAVAFGVYALFFAGPWQCAVATAGYWLAADFATRVWIWILRYQNEKLRIEGEKLKAQREKLLWELRASHAKANNLKLRIECARLHTEDMRAQEAVLVAQRKKMEEELRAAWMELGRREERARIEFERTEANVVHLELLAKQLGLRADWLESRLDRTQLTAAVREFQEAIEDRIQQAYQRGFVHGATGASFVPSRPHLSVVSSPA